MIRSPLDSTDQTPDLTITQFIQDNYIFSYNFHPFLPDINEDVFWGILIPRSIPTFTVPTVQEAAMFSFEVCPEYLFQLTKETLPFGCHAWEKYNKKFWEKKTKFAQFQFIIHQ